MGNSAIKKYNERGKMNHPVITTAIVASLLAGIVGCSTIGHPFRSDAAVLSQLVVGETTPEDAVRILKGEPYIRQNLPDGTLAWHWQHIVSGAYVGITDNRYLVLIFKRSEDGSSWRFRNVMHAQNIDLPPGLPFGAVVR